MGKKKMSKQEKKKLEAEQAEAHRIEMEKERQRQLEEERERKIQELQEAKERQRRDKEENKIRRVQLNETGQNFGSIAMEINKIYTQKRNAKEWDRYMRCNGFPNAYDPGDLRKYMHMWQLEKENSNRTEQNWLLQTNERSVLTQDQTIPNLTRQYLKAQQLNLSDVYSKRVVEILGILSEIQEAIYEPNSLTESIVQDLHNLKYELRQLLSGHIDELSHKILSNIERDMELEGLMTARYLYESDVFKMQIWTMLDIPQPLLNEKERQKESKKFVTIDFQALKINLMLPPSVKLKKSAVRGMWLSYDHFSDYCPTFDLPVKISRNLDVGVAARREWRQRKEIMKASSIDGPDEMLNPLNTTIVDVDKIYSEFIDDQNKMRRQKMAPNSLQLKEFEINLRRYRVISGVYTLEYLEQPEQDTKLQPNFFLKTLIGTSALKRKRFFQYFRMPPPVAPGVRRLPEEAEAEMKMVEKGLSKLTSITIVMPEDVIFFEPPTVCRWETVDETEETEKIEKKPSGSSRDRPTNERHEKSSPKSKVVNDFNLLDIPPGVDLNCIMKEFVIPRLPEGFVVKIEEKTMERKKSILKLVDTKDLKPHTDKDLTESHPSIRTILQHTTSPRRLHPKVILKRDLQIIEGPSRKNSDVEKGINESVYMLSELLKDLDQLCDEQRPYPEKKIEEISIASSKSPEPEVVEEEKEPEYGTTFLRATEYPWGIQAKEPETPQVEDESEDSDQNDDENNLCIQDNVKKEVIGRWSVRDIHDSKFNEDKLAIQFRSGRLGIFGLAVNWFSNLPFQTWELKPDLKTMGTVSFSLTAAVVSMEISINDEGLQLNSFQGGICPIIQDIISKVITLSELQSTLKRAGINLFPDEDAFCYCEGACEKDIVMESHLYTCMAYMALTHSFSWSRWNIMQNSRSAVLLMREMIEHRKTPNHSTLLVTPLKTLIVDCTDVSPSFVPTPVEGMNFYADLYHLNEEHSLPVSKAKQIKTDSMLRDTAAKLLQSVRPLSFC